MSNLKLRSLHPEDLDRVADIESRIAGSPRRAFLEKRLAVATATPESFITCAAMTGDTLAGYGFARIQEGDFGVAGAVAVLDVIGVEPGLQGQGIGRAVLACLEERMKKQGICSLRTQTAWADLAMNGFFARSGFTLSASRIIERDTSPLLEEVAEVKSIKMDGKWRVHSGGGDDYEALSRDRVFIRSLRQEDLANVVRIDGKLTGMDRSAYYHAKFREMLIESGIRVSLVAEDDGIITGFIMARVDFGEFGKVDKAAVIDTIGVHPAYRGARIGHALLSQLLANLSILQVESVRTQVLWEHYGLQRFLHQRGFSQADRLVLVKGVC